MKTKEELRAAYLQLCNDFTESILDGTLKPKCALTPGGMVEATFDCGIPGYLFYKNEEPFMSYYPISDFRIMIPENKRREVYDLIASEYNGDGRIANLKERINSIESQQKELSKKKSNLNKELKRLTK